VPRGWLKKTSSGKIARSANVKRFLDTRDQQIFVLGNSHVSIFQKDITDTTHLASANIHPVLLKVLQVASTLPVSLAHESAWILTNMVCCKNRPMVEKLVEGKICQSFIALLKAKDYDLAE